MEKPTSLPKVGDLIVAAAVKLQQIPQSWTIDLGEVCHDPIRIAVRKLPLKDPRVVFQDEAASLSVLRSHLQGSLMAMQGKSRSSTKIDGTPSSLFFRAFPWGSFDLTSVKNFLANLIRSDSELRDNVEAILRKRKDTLATLTKLREQSTEENVADIQDLEKRALDHQRHLDALESKARLYANQIRIAQDWINEPDGEKKCPEIILGFPSVEFVFWGSPSMNLWRDFIHLLFYSRPFLTDRDVLKFLKTQIFQILPEDCYLESKEHQFSPKPLLPQERKVLKKTWPKEKVHEYSILALRKYQILQWNTWKFSPYVPLGKGEKSQILFPVIPPSLAESPVFQSWFGALQNALSLKKIRFRVWKGHETVGPALPLVSTEPPASPVSPPSPVSSAVDAPPEPQTPTVPPVLVKNIEKVVGPVAPPKPKKAKKKAKKPTQKKPAEASKEAKPASKPEPKVAVKKEAEAKAPAPKKEEPKVPTPKTTSTAPTEKRKVTTYSDADRAVIRELLALQKGNKTPKWALRALTLNRSKAIADIKAKTLTSKTFQSWSKSAKPSTPALTAEALKKQWTNAKKKFKGVPLLSNPNTVQEKALKAEFDKVRVARAALLPKERAAFKLPQFSRAPNQAKGGQRSTSPASNKGPRKPGPQKKGVQPSSSDPMDKMFSYLERLLTAVNGGSRRRD